MRNMNLKCDLREPAPSAQEASSTYTGGPTLFRKWWA